MIHGQAVLEIKQNLSLLKKTLVGTIMYMLTEFLNGTELNKSLARFATDKSIDLPNSYKFPHQP